MQKLVELKNVTAGYENEIAIENADFSVYEHDFIGIIGPNGGGKTTLLKVMLGLQRPWKGSVEYYLDGGGQNLIGQMGYLPQINKFDDKFPVSVYEVVRSGLATPKKLFSRFSKEDNTRILETLQDLGISHLKEKSIGELSGGQKQRVFLARAIVSEPKLLFLDEPNTYVDNKFEAELYEMLHYLNQRMAIVLVSHDLGTISAYIKSIVCVNKSVHYHDSNTISEEQLSVYNCPIQLITHGTIPHTVLKSHSHE
ncbi:MAG: metal ABC transporter ATP-binding protein [Bacteroidales bacterium]|nr:metal ABC transporter ATP-binding protein [Bacteroidales bacterium]MCF8328653.1 metal ABC transporter ATP-binding protein [Bacteroidales bacterium]